MNKEAEKVGAIIKRIVILDDEAEVLNFMARCLQGPGIEIIACRELEAAETILQNEAVDVLVTDLNVSELGGLEAMRLVRHTATHFPDVDIVVVTGSGGEDAHRMGRRLGARLVLQKPVPPEELRRQVLGSKNAVSGKGGRIISLESLESYLRSGNIRSHIQPIMRINPDSTPHPHAVECLARGPEESLLRNPLLLFSYANKKDMLFRVDMECIQAALQEVRDILPEIRVFINVQPRSLSHPDFSARLQDAIAVSGVNIESIVLELTEQHTILNPTAFRRTLDALRGLGILIAMDDYGEGMANLKLLHELCPDYLKLSGHFCKDIDRDETRQIIVETTFDMAARLDIPVIVEQVETQVELDTLREFGEFFAQGYLFSKPLPFKSLTSFGLQRQKKSLFGSGL